MGYRKKRENKIAKSSSVQKREERVRKRKEPCPFKRS
jgi:hypothetical protein